MRMSICFLLITFFAVALAASAPASAETVISDSIFSTSDWLTQVNYSSGASQTALQAESGGNSYRYSYRYMTHSKGPNSTIGVTHVFLGANFNPSIQGAIDHIDYTETRIEFAPPWSGAAIGATFVLRQGGVDYYSSDLTFTNSTWNTISLNNLKAIDFGSSSHPDLSATGGPIQFGYERSNTNSSSSGSYLLQHGIDNRAVTITPVPEVFLLGDANKDGTVNVADLTLLLNNYNKTGQTWADGDFDGDGITNVADLTILLNNYNRTSGAGLFAGTAVPEPDSLAMLAGIALTALLYRWRKRA
jgi:hypothetical protein